MSCESVRDVAWLTSRVNGAAGIQGVAMGLEQLINRGDVWRGPGMLRSSASASRSTGHPQLDRMLPGGWPRAELIELLYDQPGIGELQLLLPLLCAAEAPGWLMWVDPPLLPCASTLHAQGLPLERMLVVHTRTTKERLWTMEQALKSGCCTVVLGWLPTVDTTALRRLQLAVAEGGNWGLVMRPRASRQHSSPAPWRLLLEPEEDARALSVTLFKRKGGWALPRCRMPLSQRSWREVQPEPSVNSVPQARLRGEPELRLVGGGA